MFRVASHVLTSILGKVRAALDGRRRSRWSFLSTSRRTEQRVFRSTNISRADGPCQHRRKIRNFKRLQLRWQLRLTAGLHTYCCEFGVPRDCSPGTAAGHCSQTSYAFCCGVGPPPTYGVPNGDFDANVLESTEVSAAPLLI